MALNKDNVRVGITGAVYRAPKGTALPTDATTALNAAFIDVGYISDEGVTLNVESESTEIRAAQFSAVVRAIQTSHTVTAAFTMIETNDESQKIFWADEDATKESVEIRGGGQTEGAWVLEILDGKEIMRAVFADGAVTERGEVQLLNDEEVTGYPVTITFMEAAGNVKGNIYRATAE